MPWIPIIIMGLIILIYGIFSYFVVHHHLTEFSFKGDGSKIILFIYYFLSSIIIIAMILLWISVGGVNA